MTLNNWDFEDTEKNGTTQQINRMKSAQNVEIIELDPDKRTGVFAYKNKPFVKTSLDCCECHDFNFSGMSPRKKFAPCMHIYRLAMEFGLFINPHFKIKHESTADKNKREFEALKILKEDSDSWGSWNPEIHKSQLQHDRQQRAMDIFTNNDFEIYNDKESVVSGYRVSLSSCNCMDFRDRRLPCKHIYCMAIALNLFNGI